MEKADFNIYLKNKLLNYYKSNKRIGYGVGLGELELEKLLKKFDFFPNNNETINEITEQEYKNFIATIQKNPVLMNKIGFTEFDLLTFNKYNEKANFLKIGTYSKLSIPTGLDEHSISQETEKIAKKYGLVSLSAYWNPLLSSPENIKQIMFGLCNIEKELSNIQKNLSLKNSEQVGNQLIGIEFNKKVTNPNE